MTVTFCIAIYENQYLSSLNNHKLNIYWCVCVCMKKCKEANLSTVLVFHSICNAKINFTKSFAQVIRPILHVIAGLF